MGVQRALRASREAPAEPPNLQFPRPRAGGGAEAPEGGRGVGGLMLEAGRPRKYYYLNGIGLKPPLRRGCSLRNEGFSPSYLLKPPGPAVAV